LATFSVTITDSVTIAAVPSRIITLAQPVITNPYAIPDADLIDTFHRASPDFDFINLVNSELHALSAAPCRIYKLDHTQSVTDPDDIYSEYQYRVYLPPIIIDMYFITPTWTEELNKLGVNMPEEVVFSANLQQLMYTIGNARAASSSAHARITIGSSAEEPDKVYIYCDGEKLYSKWETNGTIAADPDFELNILNQAGTIDLHHPAVKTIKKLTDYINNLTNYTATYTGEPEVPSSKIEDVGGDINNINDWYEIKNSNILFLAQRIESIYDNVADVIESGDIIETFRRHADTRNAVEGNIPIHDPVTLQPVRGKLYEVRYAFLGSETPTRHYVNYNITADKVAMDVYEELLSKLPGDEPWTVGGDRWYA